MTEAEWLAATDPTPMLEFLKGKPGERKLRLAVCAFCSHINVATRDDFFHAAFNASERYADKLVSWEAVEKLAARTNQFARHGDFIQQTAAVLPVYLLSRDADLNYAAWGSANSAWNHPIAVRQAVVALNITYIRDIFGNPFRPVAFSREWRTDTAVSLARQMYESRDFSAMPILADALQDAGCDNDDVLDHCRDVNATHVRGCWVVDAVLNKV